MKLRRYYDNWESVYINNLLNYELNSIIIGDFDSDSGNLTEIEEYFKKYSFLQWEILHKVRFLYVKCILFGITGNEKSMKKLFEELKVVGKSFLNKNELMNFYIESACQIIIDNTLSGSIKDYLISS
ncbi:hypothetical protein [Lactococcus sp. dk322]|uniref:hypothetical protein n=1 Tax=Lactococcus sp. dk322 TaxID=2603290 RepID=UPI0011C75CF0|nr:hypothetical protein [Lactococcus sp. dk322]